MKNDIFTGVYPSGSRIPSEQTLGETYGVSRVTVRKAMLDIAQEGLIIRRQGKGTFVAGKRLQRNLQHITSFSDACRNMRRTASAKMISVTHELARPEDCERLGVPADGRVLEICRLRLCDNEPVMVEINRFPEQYAFLEQTDLTRSLYELLGERGIFPNQAVHDISLGHATPLVSRYLGTPPNEALLILDEIVLDRRRQPLHSSRQWIRGDKFTFRI